MATLNPPTNRTHPFAQQIGDALAPAGTFVATVLDIKDEFAVTRQKYQSTEMEKVDLTAFLFGFRDAQGRPHRIASKQMKISGSEKSALFGFLKSMLGKAPAYGWDFCSLRGQKCLVTIEHVERRDGSGAFAAIASLSLVPEGFGTATGRSAPAARPQPPVQRPIPAPQPAPTAPAADAELDQVPF